MPHTASRYQQDSGFTDGVMFFGPDSFIATGGASVLTRNAAGDISHNAGAGVSPIYTVLMSGIQLRTGFGEDIMNQFGGAGIYGSAGPQGRPDTFGAMSAQQELTPRSTFKIKGLKLTSVSVVYLVGGAALTAATCRLDKIAFANNVANAISPMIASAANGLLLPIQANPYVIEVPVTTPAYTISDNSEIIFEFAPTTQAAGTLRFYGIRVKCEFNFN